MKAETYYQDLVGTSSVDLHGDLHKSIAAAAARINLDTDKYEPIGIHIYGLEKLEYSIICIDKQNSTKEDPRIVKILIDSEKHDINLIINTIDIVAYPKYGSKHTSLDPVETIKIEDED